VKILYEEAKWKSIASALEKVNEAHKYDNKYEHADVLFKDSKSEIADKDIDRAISFSPQTYQPEAKPIREKYKKLYNYAKGIGKIIDEKVDEPFYKSIDEYMQQMADMNVSAYTTANTINVQTGPFFYRHDKKEIKLTDLYEGDTEYSDNLKAEYEAWKLQNPDVKASQEDYETAALNSGAFEYEGIRAGQEKKEFWFNLIAIGVVVGLTIVCPPAGLVAGAAYTAIDVGGAITGEDLISGRKLSDNERLVRGAFAIVPGAGAAAGKALLKNMPALANVIKSAYKTVENAGGSALKSTLEHARNLGKAHGDQLKFTLKHPVLAAVTSKTGQQTVRQSAKFIDNALRPIEVRAVQTNAGNVVTGVERGLPSGKLPAKADEYLAVKQAEKDGVLAGKSTGNVHSSEIDEVIKNDYDINGNLINRSVVPKGYESVEDFLKAVDDTTIKEYGYDSIEEFKAVVEHVDDFLNASPKNNIVNKGLAGGKHVKGVDYDVLGFPIFKGVDVKFSLKLNVDLYKATDETQFKKCTSLLKEAIEQGNISKDIFTSKQLRDIENGEARIKGLTWHHHQVPGKMQLVVSKTHKVNHLGGNKLWGDGIR